MVKQQTHSSAQGTVSGAAEATESTSGSHYYVRLPHCASLYVPSAELAAWRQAVEAVLTAHPDNSLSFVSDGWQGDDWHILRSHILLSQSTLAHLSELRQFFARLFSQRHRLEFWATSLVIDSFFELMLCCHRVLHGDPLAMVGFSEWQRGFAPLGGVCELRLSAGCERKNFWQKTSWMRVWNAPSSWSIQVIPAPMLHHELRRLGVDYWMENPSSTWTHRASCWKARWLRGGHFNSHQLKWMKTLLTQALQPKPVSHIQTKWQSLLKEESWELMWQQSQNSSSSPPEESESTLEQSADTDDAVDAVDEVIVKYLKELMYGWHRVLMLGATPHGDYGESLKHRWSYHPRLWQGWAGDVLMTSRSSRQQAESEQILKIWVDVSVIFAPLKLIIYWLSHNVEVVFISRSRSSLRRRIEILRHSLWDMFDKDDAIKLMTQLSFLCISHEEQEKIMAAVMGRTSSSVLLSFRKDGSLRVRSALGRHDYLRLAGNEFGAELGVGESRGEPVVSDYLWAAQVLRCEPLGVYGSVWLRAHFLRLVCQEAGGIKGGVPAVLKQLADLGWLMDEDEKDWAVFVTSQSDIFVAKSQHHHARLKWRLDDDFPWGMPWHQVLAWSKRYGVYQRESARKARYRVKALLGEHFLIFALLLAIIMVEQGWVESYAAADEFVRLALGVPIRYGSLLAKFDMMAEVMLKEYAATECADLRAHRAIRAWCASMAGGDGAGDS